MNENLELAKKLADLYSKKRKLFTFVGRCKGALNCDYITEFFESDSFLYSYYNLFK